MEEPFCDGKVRFGACELESAEMGGQRRFQLVDTHEFEFSAGTSDEAACFAFGSPSGRPGIEVEQHTLRCVQGMEH